MRDKERQHETSLSDSEDEGTGGRKHRQNHGEKNGKRNGSNGNTNANGSSSGRKAAPKIGDSDKALLGTSDDPVPGGKSTATSTSTPQPTAIVTPTPRASEPMVIDAPEPIPASAAATAPKSPADRDGASMPTPSTGSYMDSIQAPKPVTAERAAMQIDGDGDDEIVVTGDGR